MFSVPSPCKYESHCAKMQASDHTGTGEAPGAWKRGTNPRLVSHKHTEICSAVFNCAIISVCPLKWSPSPRTACCHHCERLLHATALCLLVAQLQHNEDGLHHPLTHKPAHAAKVKTIRLFQEES